MAFAFGTRFCQIVLSASKTSSAFGRCAISSLKATSVPAGAANIAEPRGPAPYLPAATPTRLANAYNAVQLIHSSR